MTDRFNRTITSIDNGDGTTTYSTPDQVSITVPNGDSVASIISTFNGLSPSLANASFEKQNKLKKFQADLSDFINSRYDLETRVRFLMLYTIAVQNGLTNRAAYLQALLDWGNAVTSYAGSFAQSVMAQSDPATISGMQWDFTQITLPDPQITLLGAVSISN